MPRQLKFLNNNNKNKIGSDPIPNRTTSTLVVGKRLFLSANLTKRWAFGELESSNRSREDRHNTGPTKSWTTHKWTSGLLLIW